MGSKGEEQFERTLAHIAGAPAAAGILFEATRGKIMHESVVHEPGKDFRE